MVIAFAGWQPAVVEGGEGTEFWRGRRWCCIIRPTDDGGSGNPSVDPVRGRYPSFPSRPTGFMKGTERWETVQWAASL